MAPVIKLLIIEDDVTSQLMLKTMLSEYSLTIVDTGEAGLEAAKDNPDIIILDINLPGINGYETCQQFRMMEITQETPIIFLSSYTGLDERLQAYGVGGNDYISKPFDVRELKTKIEHFGTAAERHLKQKYELDSSAGLLFELQTSAANLQSISRFIQATLFCHNVDDLCTHFFKTAREIGIECTLMIHDGDTVVLRGADGEVTALEKEILEMSVSVERIHQFGQDRAIFRWGHATLLTRKVGDLIDILAIFMDALEAGVKSVNSEYRLLQQIEQVEAQNTEVRNRVAELFSLMTDDLKDAILQLGLVSVLDVDDEDRLHDLMEKFSGRIDEELKVMAENNGVLQKLVTELRTPPPELQSLMEEEEEEDDFLF